MVEQLFGALERQTLDNDRFEVIVVDDASRDRTLEVAREWAAGAEGHRRVLQGSGRGPGHARNVGIEAARGEWLAFTDSDTVPDPDWLESALAAVARLHVDALEGAVEPWPPEAIGPYTQQVATFGGGRYMTANMIYRAELVRRLGGFDERFGQFLEDSDLAFRVLDSGIDIPFVPEVRVRHQVRRASTLAVLRSTRRVRWTALLAKKHPARYREQLRPKQRPLTSVDIDVLLGLIAFAAAATTSGFALIVLVVLGANGVRRGIGSSQALRGPLRDAPRRALLGLLLPVTRAFWWLEGCVRFRRFVW